MAEVTYISKRKLKEHDLETLMNLAWAFDEQAFINAFAKNGITIHGKNDITDLVELSRGGDVAGAFRDGNGRCFPFSVVKIFGTIDVSHDKINKSNIKFID